MNSPPTHSRDPLIAKVRAVLDDTLSDLVQAGLARIEEDPTADQSSPDFLIRPQEPQASPLHIYVQAPDELIVLLGAHRTQADLYGDDQDALVATLRTWVRAVVQGSYTERVMLDEGRLDRAIGKLVTEEGPISIKYNVLFGRFARGSGWTRINYAPYVPRSDGQS